MAKKKFTVIIDDSIAEEFYEQFSNWKDDFFGSYEGMAEAQTNHPETDKIEIGDLEDVEE